jgi:hypothetical protein
MAVNGRQPRARSAELESSATATGGPSGRHRSALADLPDGDRIGTFDAYRARVLELPDAIEAASSVRR